MLSARFLGCFPLLVSLLTVSALSWARPFQDPAQGQGISSESPAPSDQLTGAIIVSYQNDELTIESQNATLREMLRAISNQTGIMIEVPPGPDERVIGVFGPRRTRDVLDSLLNGSRFNYIFVGSANDPNTPARMILSPRPTDVSKGDRTPPPPTVAQAPVVAQPPTELAPEKLEPANPNPPRQTASSIQAGLYNMRHRRRR